MIGAGLAVLMVLGQPADTGNWCGRPGECWMSQGAAWRHVGVKAGIGLAAYGGLRAVGVPRAPAALLGVVGTFAVGKAIEIGKGHTIPLGDGVHDLLWHGALVWPLAARTDWQVGMAVVGTAVGLLVTLDLARPRLTRGRPLDP